MFGNGDKVASILEKKGISIRKVENAKPFPRSRFWSILSGGFAASIKKKEKLKDYNKNLDEFDEVIIGSPIWNSRFSTPINTVLNDLSLKDKKVSFVLYSGSGEAPKAIARIEKEYPGSSVVVIKEPKDNSNLEKLLETL
jgi:flavorubredoxin